MTEQTSTAAPVAATEAAVRRLLQYLGAEATRLDYHAQALPEGGVIVTLAITVPGDGRQLIGNHGSHLAALQHLVRCMVRRQSDTPLVSFTVDVNGYRARREQSLMQLAEEVARRARSSGRTISLEPMRAPDRRAIHTALAHHTDIHTESVGAEPHRRVLVKPVFL